MQEKRVRLSKPRTPTREDIDREGRKIWHKVMLDELFWLEARPLLNVNSRLLRGEVSCAQAEAELECEGFVFDKLSDPTFDPNSCFDWTPLQAIAWIATRDKDRVRAVSPEARRRTVVWSASSNVADLSHPSFSLLDDISQAAEQARADLWARLRQGEIQASGLNAAGAPRVAINSLEWADLRLFRGDVVFLGNRTFMGNGFNASWFPEGSHAYFEARIDRNAIVAILPGPKAGDDDARARAEATPEKGKGGRRPSHDWDAIKEKCFELLDYHDDFIPEEPEWNCQARLEECLKQYCLDQFNRSPPDSTLREKLRGWLSDWRSRKLKT